MGFTLQLLAGEYDGKQFIADLVWIIYAIMAAVEVVMALYACYIGYLFATASDEGKRRTAKSRLFKVIASGLIIVALVAALRVVDVRFTNVSGNFGADNQGSFGNGATTSYEATPREMNFTCNKRSGGGLSITGNVVFLASQIYRKNGDDRVALGSEIKHFYDAKISRAPSGFPQTSMPTANPNTTDPWMLIVITDTNPGQIGFEIQYGTRAEAVEFPAYKDENGKLYIEALTLIDLGGGKQESVILKITLNTRVSGDRGTSLKFKEVSA